MIVSRVFKSRQRKRKNISIVLSSHNVDAKNVSDKTPDYIGGFC